MRYNEKSGYTPSSRFWTMKQHPNFIGEITHDKTYCVYFYAGIFLVDLMNVFHFNVMRSFRIDGEERSVRGVLLLRRSSSSTGE